MSFKKFALALSLFAMSTGVVMTTTSCACSRTRRLTVEERIVAFINNRGYEMPAIPAGAKYEDLLAYLTPENVRNSLPDDLALEFIDESLTIHSIVFLDSGEEITDDSLNIPGSIIPGAVIYSYGGILNQSARIDIPITSNDDQEVVESLWEQRYTLQIEINSTYEDLKRMITPAFMKSALSPELQEKFNDSAFQLHDIDYRDNSLVTDQDLRSYGLLEPTWIFFAYSNVRQIECEIDIRVISKNEDDIVAAVNSTEYELEVTLKDTYEQLKSHLNASFVKDPLDIDLQVDFHDDALKLNSVTDENGVQLTDQDLVEAKVIQGRLHYDYGSSVNQVTNLTITVTKLQLENVLANFQMRDRKNVRGFADNNGLDNIEVQLETYLGINDISEEGLYFDNFTRTAVDVKAFSTSEFYQGQATISWNLKIFEIFGANVSNARDADLRNGLKVYFYLEALTDLIKVFDIYLELDGGSSVINSQETNYHRFRFANNANPVARKDFTINGRWRTFNVVTNFGEFFYNTSMSVQISGPAPARVRMYSYTNGAWANGAAVTVQFNERGRRGNA